MSIAAALPDRLEFYLLGWVTREDNGPKEIAIDADSACVGFQIYGERPAWVFFLFDPSLDHSTYTELGNTLTSRLADGLAREDEVPVMISPPKRISPEHLGLLMKPGVRFEHCLYGHINEKGERIEIQTLILSTSSYGLKDGIAHA